MPRRTYRWEPLDHNERRIRTHNWGPDLLNEPGTAITNSWAFVDPEDESGVTIVNQTMVGDVQEVTITGGTPDTEAKLTIRVEINGGEQSWDIGIRFNVVQW